MAEPTWRGDEVLPPSLLLGADPQSVMRVLVRDGAASRLWISQRTGLLEPTVSSVVGELERAGWIVCTGDILDDSGRPGMGYQVAPRSAGVVGADIGGTKIRAAVADLGGGVIAEQVEPTCPDSGAALARQLSRMCRTLACEAGIPWERIIVAAAGSPGFIEGDHGRAGLAGNVPELARMNVAAEFAGVLEKEVLVENDLNLAVIGEHWKGHGRGLANLCLIGVGTGLGMGIIVDGRLRRGSRGAAGEIGYLPIGTDTLSPQDSGLGAFEEVASGVGIARRYQELSGVGTNVEDVENIFEQARNGNELAQAVIDEEARLLALAAASVAAVLDPELIVFSGGVGSQDSLIKAVSERLAYKAGPRPVIKVALLGARAGLIGAIGIALGRAHQLLFSAPDTLGGGPSSAQSAT